MRIANEFTVHTPIERAWRVLTDLEGIAPCMPGARLTGVDGDVYQGKVKVKVGPVISEFAGTARFTEKDDAAYRGVIDAKGRDARSAGNAAALVTAVLRANGDSTTVSVDTDLKISGKLAQFGSGMIKEVSGKLLAQFVANLEAKLAAEDPTPDAVDGVDAVNPVDPVDRVDPVDGVNPVSPADHVDAVDSVDPVNPVSPADHVDAVNPVNPVNPVDPVDLGVPTASVHAAPPASAPRPSTPADEPEPLDLLSIAGGSIYKRLIPVVAGVVVIGAVIAWLVARR